MHTNENTIIQSLLITTVFVFGVIGYFLYILFKMYRSKLSILASREETNLAAADKERQLVALDLHDDLGPILTAARYKISSIESTDTNDLKLQEEAINHIQLVVRRLRDWADQLSPPAVLQQSPFHRLHEFIESLGPTPGFEINIRESVLPVLPPERSMHIFRMLQEIIHNAVKYSKGSGMTIYSVQQKDMLVITSIDDGIGFNTRLTENRTAGTGLHNLRVRARLLKADLVIESAAGEGTRHTIKLPI